MKETIQIFLILSATICWHQAQARTDLKNVNTQKAKICFPQKNADIEVIEISRPHFPDQKTQAQSPFRFMKITNNPDAATMVYLQGGPGSDVFNKFKLFRKTAPFKFFNIVIADLRGLGCNDSGFPEKSFSTRNFALDIKAAIRHLKLKNYFLFGASYGTVHGTVLAHLIENDRSMEPPKKLVLEGVFGRAKAEVTQAEAFIRAWKVVMSNLNSKVRAEFRRLNPYGIKDEDWASRISSILYYNLPGVLNFFNSLESNKKTFAIDQLKKMKPEGTLKFAGKNEKLRMKILCREIGDFDPRKLSDVEFKNGELHLIRIEEDPEKICGQDLRQKRYDSIDYQLRTSIVYLQGQLDPATPIEGALYHFRSQYSAEKLFVKFPGGGHTPSNMFSDCQKEVWTSIADRNMSNVQVALSKCTVRTTVL